MDRYIAYIRVSTDEQADSGLGLEAQRTAIMRACGREPDAWYQDDISGKRADRPGLLAALADVGKGDTLIVAKRDRLARDVMLVCWIEKEIKKSGSSIRSAAGEGTENDDPTNVLMRRMIDAFAEYERLIIIQRTKAALMAKQLRGEALGSVAPYGWRHEAGRRVPDAGEQEILELMGQMAGELGYGKSRTAWRLNDLGYSRRNGRKWTPNAVAWSLRAAERYGVPAAG